MIEVADKELGCETGWNSQVPFSITRSQLKMPFFNNVYDAVVAFRSRPLLDLRSIAHLAAGFPQPSTPLP
jgi:hypothetical protein